MRRRNAGRAERKSKSAEWTAFLGTEMVAFSTEPVDSLGSSSVVAMSSHDGLASLNDVVEEH
jgi:hypothetical protein